jgi:hypothetical protein
MNVYGRLSASSTTEKPELPCEDGGVIGIGI